MKTNLITQSVVILNRVELRKKALEFSARGNELATELAAYNIVSCGVVAVTKNYLDKKKEMDEVRAVAEFIRGLLEEEKVDPADFGIPVEQIG